jgi:hypothetical protein
MPLASLIDVDALWHVALYSAVAAVGVVTAYGTAVLALDRAEREHKGLPARLAWMLTVAVSGLVCVALLIVGLWAMTQK